MLIGSQFNDGESIFYPKKAICTTCLWGNRVVIKIYLGSSWAHLYKFSGQLTMAMWVMKRWVEATNVTSTFAP